MSCRSRSIILTQEVKGGLPEEGHLHGDQNDERDQLCKDQSVGFQAVGTAIAKTLRQSTPGMVEEKPGSQCGWNTETKETLVVS